MRYLILALSLVFTTSSLSAQTTYQLQNSGSEVTVQGTSTVHDWESTAEKVNGSAKIELNENQISSIENLDFRVEVKSIKSGKRIMDKKTHGALDEKSNPEIIFNLDTVNEISESSISVTGTLSIAGVKNTITLEGDYQVNNDGQVQIVGSKSIKMTDYKIDPPTAMMGTMKTGDEVTISFNVLYIKN